jgi:CBS domain-containing protein
MWLAMIGLFLFATAKASRQQAVLRETLALAPVRELMARAVVGLPPDLTVESAVKKYFLPHGFSGFPVMLETKVLGLVTIQDLQRLPQTLWVWREVRDVMRPLAPEMTVSAECSALQALEQMAAAEVDRLLVMEDGRLVGLVTRSTIWRYLHLQAKASS